MKKSGKSHGISIDMIQGIAAKDVTLRESFLIIVALKAHNCRIYVQKPSATEDSLQIGDYNHDIYNFVFHGVYYRFNY